MSGMERRHEAIAVVRHNGRILLMKRSATKKYYPLKWENAGGGIAEGESPEEAVLREAEEETGLKCRIIRKGGPFDVPGYGIIFVVHPFLVEPGHGNVKLSREHTEYRWTDVHDYKKFDCVDGIEKDYQSLGLIDS